MPIYHRPATSTRIRRPMDAFAQRACARSPQADTPHVLLRLQPRRHAVMPDLGAALLFRCGDLYAVSLDPRRPASIPRTNGANVPCSRD